MRHQPTTSFRCTLGHSLSPEQLAAASDKNLTRTLWACLRQLEERQWLLTQLAARANAPTTPSTALQATIQHLREWLPTGPAAEEA